LIWHSGWRRIVLRELLRTCCLEAETSSVRNKTRLLSRLYTLLHDPLLPACFVAVAVIALSFSLSLGGCDLEHKSGGSDDPANSGNAGEDTKPRTEYIEINVRTLSAVSGLPIAHAQVSSQQSPGGADYRSSAETDDSGLATIRVFVLSSSETYYRESVTLSVNAAVCRSAARTVTVARENELFTFNLAEAGN
jgi:hypothetical protein